MLAQKVPKKNVICAALKLRAHRAPARASAAAHYKRTFFFPHKAAQVSMLLFACSAKLLVSSFIRVLLKCGL